MANEETRVIAIAGNPNSGKTTLFNALTGSNQRTGNWPGVTVEKKTGSLESSGKAVTVVDLPGIYSLSCHSEDELVARDYLLSGAADAVLNIVDASNLEYPVNPDGRLAFGANIHGGSGFALQDRP